MKKLLGMLSILGLSATFAGTVTACQIDGGTKIALDNTNVTIDLNDTNTKNVSVNNYSALSNVTATSSNENVVTVTGPTPGGTLILTGVANGTATIRVSSDSSTDSIIQVTIVTETLVIRPNVSSVSLTGLVEDLSQEITISNYSKLTDLKVSIVNIAIASVTEISTDGKFTVTGLSTGATTIKLKADNADEISIDVKIQIQEKILLDGLTNNAIEVVIGTPGVVTITNSDIAILGNVGVASSVATTATVAYENGTITITGLVEGASIITVSAVNALESKTFTANVKAST